jgi:curli biogenesis system outer membrane secretion channel CsgG
MKRITWLFCLAALAAPALGAQNAPAPTPTPTPTPAARRRVAVLDFDYATVHSYVTDAFGSDVDIGKGIVNMLVTELVRNGTYSVIERTQVDRVLNEQNFQQEGRADASTAAKLGRLLGVDAIIIGSITQFGRDDKKLGVGGGKISLGGIGLGGLGKKSSKATVAIDARIVQIGTGEILGVAQGTGESKRSGLTLAAALPAGEGLAGGVFDMSSSNFASTILGEATRTAVTNLVTELAAAAPKIPETVVAIAALVADVSGSELIINVGTAGGVRVGTEYPVARPGREIKDPATGNVLRRATTPVGKLKITSADETSATGTLTGDPAHVGDCVGTCPLTPAAAQPAPQKQGQVPAPAPPAPSGGGAVALPALYTGAVSGPFTWTAFSFKGTEHFRYDAFVSINGSSQSGFYELDAAPLGNGRVQLRIQGRIGNEPFSTTTTIAPNEGIPPTQLAQMPQLGPLGFALLSQSYGGLFGGHSWAVGEGWSTSYGGQSFGFRVESTCQYAGVQGLRGVMRQNDKVIMDMCVSPSVGLPLAVTMATGTGAAAYSYALKLTQFRP